MAITTYKGTIVEYSPEEWETEVDIYNGITVIDYDVFKGCKGLKSVRFPDTLDCIAWSAFEDCSSLTSVIMPASLRIVEDNAFKNCTALESVILSENMTDIMSEAFKGCTSLRAVVIPNSVINIKRRAFFGCTSLSSVTLLGNVKSIGVNAFSDTALYNDSSKWENGALYIGNCLIKVNSDVSGEFTVRAGTKLIAECAFDGSAVTTVILPESVQCINDNAFKGAYALSTIVVHGSIFEVGENILDRSQDTVISISDPKNVPQGLKIRAVKGFLKEYAEGRSDRQRTRNYFRYFKKRRDHVISHLGCFLPLYYFLTKKDLIYLDEIDEMIDNTDDPSIVALLLDYKNSRLSDPENVRKLECLNLRKTERELGAPPTEDELRRLWEFKTEEDNTVTVTDYKGYSKVVTVPSLIGDKPVFAIGPKCFFDNDGIESVTVPKGIRVISQLAFGGCTNLKEINLPVGLTEIEAFAFKDCDALKQVFLPNSLEHVGYKSFEELSLRPLPSTNTFCAGNHILASYFLANRRRIIRQGIMSLTDKVYENSRLISIFCPDGMTEIGKSTFKNCKEFKLAILPASIKRIGRGAFKGCDDLTICAPEGSYVEKYARENNIKYKKYKYKTSISNKNDLFGDA